MRDETKRALSDVGFAVRCLWPVAVGAVMGAVALAVVVLLTGGCSGAEAEAQAVQADDLVGRFEWHETGTTSTYVLVDRETGVCYVARYRCGLSVMVGADGEPVTVGEIGGDDGTSDR